MTEQEKPRAYRVRDPVHGLIVFEKGNDLDQLAWKLINTPEFQRLRRIRQLGVSEFVFPGATHTRFAHSLGVFHNARKLIDIIDREMPRIGEKPEKKREEVAVIAALLHDLGHGPFSHTFEGVEESRGIEKRHEQWTADIIRNPDGAIRPLLRGFWKDRDFCEEVAGLLEADDPRDIYHAVVSSSFDADRLDYLRRDRLMTGTGAGAIDFDWLMEHVRVGKVPIEAPDATGGEELVLTFCLDAKALPAAEQFLLARYTLHQQVYLHKTTRCVEQMIAKLLRAVARHCQKSEAVSAMTGLPQNHPLICFFTIRPGSEPDDSKRKELEKVALASYLLLDDTAIMGSLDEMRLAKDEVISNLAARLLERRLYKTLDLAYFGQDEGTQRKHARRIDQGFAEKLKSETVIKDERASISIYTQIGGDDERTHKKLHIMDAGEPKEITLLSRLVETLKDKKTYTRYYFEAESDRDAARNPKGKP
jgi:hypothetical protein